ncbi:hypothetical protein [Flavobacterium sp. UBA7682]|uniref:hypothetical protein n=1 Tax=Flavobacterium sp. UBA7682 TaxID=1946560 RepID=UPI0025C551AF|nr:hypothetical protein [Flavobacterium sp. UBA7682]
MKRQLFALITLATIFLSSCKPSEKSVREFDMGKFCNNYHVLVFPTNATLHVFINKENPEQRFIIWKNINYKETGYGYSYSYYPDLKEMLKNGNFDTPLEAINEAKEHLPTDRIPFWLSEFMRMDEKTWITTGAEQMVELCSNE